MVIMATLCDSWAHPWQPDWTPVRSSAPSRGNAAGSPATLCDRRLRSGHIAPNGAA